MATEHHNPQPLLRTRFDRWLWERDIKNEAAGRRLGCSYEAVRRYRLPFGDPLRRIPDEETMAAILAWTDGAVTPNDFHEATAALIPGEPVQ